MTNKHYRVWVENSDLFAHEGDCGGTRCKVCGCCLHCFHYCVCNACSCSYVEGLEKAEPKLHVIIDETEVYVS